MMQRIQHVSWSVYEQRDYKRELAVCAEGKLQLEESLLNVNRAAEQGEMERKM